MADIKAAYKNFALKLHPDVTGNNEVRMHVFVCMHVSVCGCVGLGGRLIGPPTATTITITVTVRTTTPNPSPIHQKPNPHRRRPASSSS